MIVPDIGEHLVIVMDLNPLRTEILFRCQGQFFLPDKQIHRLRADQEIRQSHRVAGDISAAHIEQPHDVIQPGDHMVLRIQFVHADAHLLQLFLEGSPAQFLTQDPQDIIRELRTPYPQRVGRSVAAHNDSAVLLRDLPQYPAH